MRTHIAPPAGDSYRFLEFTHDLGKKLGYDFEAHNDPIYGMNNEYILCHYNYIGDEPSETTGGLLNSADKVCMTITPTSAFVDI